MYVRTGESHDFTPEVATSNPETFEVYRGPYIDHAQKALLDAQNEYFEGHPHKRKYASAMYWRIEVKGDTERVDKVKRAATPGLDAALNAAGISEADMVTAIRSVLNFLASTDEADRASHANDGSSIKDAVTRNEVTLMGKNN